MLRTTIGWVTVVMMFVAVLPNSLAEVVRDRLVVGSQPYVRSQWTFTPPTFEIDLSADDGVAAISWRQGGFPDDHLYLLHCDRWGEPRHAPVEVEPVLAYNAIHTLSAQRGGATVVLWEVRSGATASARVVLSNGAFATSAVTILSGVSASDTYWATTLDAHRIVFFLARTGTPFRTLVRSYTLDLAPLSDWVTTSTFLNRSNMNPQVDQLTDGRSVAAWTNSAGLEDDVLVQLLYPDGTFSPYVTFGAGPPRVCCPSLAVLDDGTIALAFGDRQTDGSWYMNVRRLDDALEVIASGDTRAIPARAAAFSPLGAATICFEPTGSTIAHQLYSADWTPIGDVADLTLPGSGESKDHQGITDPVAMDRSGNIWLVWASYNPGDDHYLTTLAPYNPGDCNHDRRINNFDIDAFVLALSDGAAYEARYHIPAEVGRILADVNLDGALNNFDIDAFVELLVSQP
ncbi:MAG: hypothetical protein AB7Q17_05880 [Phycisphaerae bacterium]